MSCPEEKTTPETCGCCESELPELRHDNPPGLSEIAYRIAKHPGFLKRMLLEIHRWEVPDGDRKGERPLQALTTRSTEDPAIALMDAWAVVADVLTFYQERIANEGFLGTATERRSLLELARSISYELDPGLAAETLLVFTVDEAPGSPEQAPIPLGTQIQSVPASQDELPQTFETQQELIARRAWNKMRPRLTARQLLAANRHVYLEGTATRLEAGDMALLKLGSVFTSLRVFRLEEDLEKERTLVKFKGASTPTVTEPWPTNPGPPPFDAGGPRLELDSSSAEQQVFDKKWSEDDLQTFLALHKWDEADLLAYVDEIRARRLKGGDDDFLALRESLGCFGHNAPRWESLPAPQNTRAGACAGAGDPYPASWDTTPRTVWQDSQGNEHTDADIYLERPVPEAVEDSWMVLETPDGADKKEFQVASTFESSRADFGMTGKVTGVEFSGGVDKSLDYKVRATTVHAVSEPLELAPLPIEDPLPPGLKELVLGEMVLGLSPGQKVALSGEEKDAAGEKRTEILELKEIQHSGGYTKLTFTSGLSFGYVRDTVSINANLVPANHGETVADEALGGGDGATPNQRFMLKKPPLTYVTASGGSESTLTLRVNGVEWTEVPSLYELAPDSRSFVVRLDDEARPSLVFGDGVKGARLPTGQENVRATYRSGIGLDGEVGAESLTLLKKRPFGIKSVTNPREAAGGDDPERIEDARINAPLQVLTLGRIVSLQDYEDYARAFPGIGKAQAITIWTGAAEVVHLTVADSDGDQVVAPLFDNLLDSIHDARDPLRDVVLANYDPFFFHLEARVLIDPAYLWEDVEADIRQRLVETFSFERREFGQPVTAAEVLQLMHESEGVQAVDLEKFFKTATLSGVAPVGEPEQILSARRARFDALSGQIQLAHLLLISEYGIELTEWKP